MALIFVETRCGHEGFEIFNSVMFALCGVRVLFCKKSTFLFFRRVSLRMSTATRSFRGILTTSPSIIILTAVAFYPTSLRVRQVRL